MAATEPLAAGLNVIEIGESIAAALAGMVLADYGADVLTIEPPEGSRLRRLAAHRTWSRGKRSLPVDLTTPSGRRRVAELSAAADVVIVALEPGTADRLGVDGATLCGANPALVHCEVTGFGRGHPLSDVPGHEGIVAARGGRAHEFSVLFGGERPAFPVVPVATYGASMLGLQGIFAALMERERTGRGQRIQTSLLGALGVFELTAWAPGGSRNLRLADVPMLFYTVARTSDGVWLQFSQNSPRLFRAFLRALELEHLLEEARFRAAPHLPDPADARDMRAILLARIGERTWQEWQAIFAGDPNVSAETFSWPGDALEHPQLLHTGDSSEVFDAEVGRVRWLGPLVSCSGTSGHVPIKGAASGRPPATEDDACSLLQGITVLELSTWIATPMATALLAELGARVIKIEPHDGDPMRQFGASGLKCVQGKESILLDLKAPEGRQIVHQLVDRADAFVHNYRPGVPERLGIDYPTLRELNPRLVYLYAASYGSSGPMSLRPAFHVTAGAVCGGALAQARGGGPPGRDVELSDQELAWWSEQLTRANEANPDFNAALAAAAATTMALFARARTGEGQALETRMMMSNAYALSEHFISYEGRPPRVFPDAELHGLHALYRLYQAAEGWVFVAAPDDRAFRRLCDGLDRPGLATDARFADGDARGRHQPELVSELEATFAARSAETWERDLAQRGVGCVQVNEGPLAAYVFDAPWAERLGFAEMAAPTGLGPYPRYGRSVRSERDLGPLGAADKAGAQTRTILAEIGYDDEMIDKLLATGVIAEATG